MSKWMDGWMDGWMDEWMNEWMNEWISKSMNIIIRDSLPSMTLGSEYS